MDGMVGVCITLFLEGGDGKCGISWVVWLVFLVGLGFDWEVLKVLGGGIWRKILDINYRFRYMWVMSIYIYIDMKIFIFVCIYNL